MPARPGRKSHRKTPRVFRKSLYGRLAPIAPSNPKRVYAFVESTDSALFVSDDGGATWSQRDKSAWTVWRPFYFANLIVDPKNPDRVFKTDGQLILSEDGGKSFATVGGVNGAHGDLHYVWIDPNNPKTVIAGDDGGIWYSYNGGNNGGKANNLPVSQFYHVSVDDSDPYRVHGGLQDTVVGRPVEYPGGITNAQWENMFIGDGFYIFSDPADPDYLYAEYQGGDLGRVNRHTHVARNIQPNPNYKEKLRFNWNTPIALRQTKRGQSISARNFFSAREITAKSWDRISPDLTTNVPEKQKQEQSGGVTVDNSAAEMHTTIYSISESPKDKRVIWAGTDDGNIQLTAMEQKPGRMSSATFRGVPKSSWVRSVQAATSIRAPRMPRLTATPSATSRPTFTTPPTTARAGVPPSHRRTKRGARLCACHQGRPGPAQPVVPWDRVRSVYFHRWRQSLGAIQRQPFPGRRRARPRDPSAR